MPCNRRQTECHQVYLNGRGAKEEGEAKEEVDEGKTKDEIQGISYSGFYACANSVIVC